MFKFTFYRNERGVCADKKRTRTSPINVAFTFEHGMRIGFLNIQYGQCGGQIGEIELFGFYSKAFGKTP